MKKRSAFLVFLLVFSFLSTLLISADSAEEAEILRKEDEIEVDRIRRRHEYFKQKGAQNPGQATFSLSKMKDISGLTPTQTARSLLPVNSPLRVKWALPLRGGNVKRIVLPRPELDLKYFVIETNQHDLIAIRSDNGEPVWWIKCPEEIFGEIFIGEFCLYFVTGGRLICVERMSGEIEWNVALPFAPSAGPTAYEQGKKLTLLYIPSMNRQMYCLDVAEAIWPGKGGSSGLKRSDFMIKIPEVRLLWQYRLAGVANNTPLVYDNYLFTGCWAKRIYGINLTNAISRGAPKDIWEYRTKAGSIARPVREGPFILVASSDQNLYCLTRQGGGLSWRYIAENPLLVAPQLVRDEAVEKVYVMQKVNMGPLVCLNRNNGKPIWQHDKGVRIIGISSQDSSSKKLRSLAMSQDNDGFLSAIVVSAPDERSAKVKKEDDFIQRHRAAKVAWRVDGRGFKAFANNVYNENVYCATADGSMVCVLEPND